MPTASLGFSRFWVTLLCLVTCGAAKAQDADAQPRALSLGLGVSWNAAPYQSYSNKVQPLPLVNYEGKSFYVRGLTAGYRLFKVGSGEFSIVVSPLGDQFKHDVADAPEMRRLSDRKLSALAGLSWQYGTGWGVVQVSAMNVVTGHGGGSLFDARYSYPFGSGKLRLIPTAGVAYRDGALNDYYYGVNAKEAARSGLPAYRAGGGAMPYAGLVATYQVSRSWQLSGGAQYTMLPKGIKDSPMVDSSSMENFFFAVSYKF